MQQFSISSTTLCHLYPIHIHSVPNLPKRSPFRTFLVYFNAVFRSHLHAKMLETKQNRMVRKVVRVQLNVHYPSCKSHIVDECIDVGGAKVEKRQECLSEE